MTSTSLPSMTKAFFRLSAPPLLLIEGADVATFLNRLLTVNTRSWAVGEGGRAHVLEHTGKIKASLCLIRFGESAWLAQSPPQELSGEKPSLADLLDMYLFGEDVRFTPLEGWQALELSTPLELSEALGHTLSLPQLNALSSSSPSSLSVWRALSPPLSLDEPQSELMWALTPMWAPYHEGRLSLSAWGSLEQTSALAERLNALGVTQLNSTEWSAERVALGAPAHGYEYTSRVTPLDVEPPNALVSVTEGKGCYPGQEVIERTLALGRASRRLVRLKRDGAPLSEAQHAEGALGAPLSLPLLNAAAPTSAPVGELTSLSPTRELLHALALIKRSATSLQQDPHARLVVGGEGTLSGLCFMFDEVRSEMKGELSDER